MRAFGPGSISSFLKTMLDVTYVILWLAAALVLAGLVAVLLFQPFLTGGGERLAMLSAHNNDVLFRHSLRVAVVMVAVEGWLASAVVVLDRLRRVFATMSAGRPFELANVRRLHVVGVAMAANQALTYVVRWLVQGLEGPRRAAPGVDVTAWFAVVVVFVLAEVFREGARLRAEAELTV